MISATTEQPVRSERRMILNSNEGVTNIIEQDVIRTKMASVTDKLFHTLKAHYGPYSKFAGIDPNRPCEDTIFTKDGANIIKNITFVSPLEDIVRKTVLYIGSNVEKSSGDGTTSSMMFMCAMLKHMTASIDEILPVSYYRLNNAFNEFLSEVKSHMHPYILTGKDADGKYTPDRVRKIAFTQAYTSSHGNIELANAVADMFANTPADVWPRMTFARRHYESDKLFEIRATSGQYEVDSCSIMSKTVFNKDTGRYLEYEDCTLVVINGKVNVNDGTWQDKVQPLIDNSDEDHPVVVFAQHGADDFSYGKLMEDTNAVNAKTGKKHAFACIWGEKTHERINDFVNIQVVSGANPLAYAVGQFSGVPCIIEHAKVRYEFERLTLDHLYEDPNFDPQRVTERPAFTKHSYFREYVETILHFIDVYETGDLTSIRQQKELRDFRNAYLRVKYDKQIYLLIGGRTFDNLAMFDVVEDVIKAVRHTLAEGAVISNNKTLYKAVISLKSEYDRRITNGAYLLGNDQLIYWFCKNVLKSLDMFSDVVMDILYPYGSATIMNYPEDSFWTRFFGGLVDFGGGLDGDMLDFGQKDMAKVVSPLAIKKRDFSDEERERFRSWWFNNSVDLLSYDANQLWTKQTKDFVYTPIDKVNDPELSKNAHLVVQPANADIVMLERFAELALKFILTERFVVCDAAYVGDKEKGKKK